MRTNKNLTIKFSCFSFFILMEGVSGVLLVPYFTFEFVPLSTFPASGCRKQLSSPCHIYQLLGEANQWFSRHAGCRTCHSAKGWSLRHILPMNG